MPLAQRMLLNAPRGRYSLSFKPRLEERTESCLEMFKNTSLFSSAMQVTLEENSNPSLDTRNTGVNSVFNKLELESTEIMNFTWKNISDTHSCGLDITAVGKNNLQYMRWLTLKSWFYYSFLFFFFPILSFTSLLFKSLLTYFHWRLNVFHHVLILNLKF